MIIIYQMFYDKKFFLMKKTFILTVNNKMSINYTDSFSIELNIIRVFRISTCGKICCKTF